MTRKELSAIIDKTVGSKGIMRASTWWVRRLFNKVVEYGESYTNSAVASVKVKCDTEMSSTSENPVQNKVIKEYVDNKKIDVDSSISSTSTNPVQNKIVKSYVDSRTAVDSAVNDYSSNAIQNKAVKVYVDSRIDDEMSDNSTNAIQNNVVKKYIDSAIGNVNSILDVINGEEI